jgi:hypothetical protein
MVPVLTLRLYPQAPSAFPAKSSSACVVSHETQARNVRSTIDSWKPMERIERRAPRIKAEEHVHVYILHTY